MTVVVMTITPHEILVFPKDPTPSGQTPPPTKGWLTFSFPCRQYGNFVLRLDVLVLGTVIIHISVFIHVSVLVLIEGTSGKSGISEMQNLDLQCSVILYSIHSPYGIYVFCLKEEEAKLSL